MFFSFGENVMCSATACFRISLILYLLSFLEEEKNKKWLLRLGILYTILPLCFLKHLMLLRTLAVGLCPKRIFLYWGKLHLLATAAF